MRHMLTIEDIERSYEDERWLGWGYLGGRKHLTEGVERDAADAIVLDYANDHGWDYETLFAWLNSKPGRWFADDPFHPKAGTCLHEVTA